MFAYPRKVVAHRGGGSLAPENTLAAMRCGLEHGFHAVEFDVMLAEDKVPIVMHDPHLGRTVAGFGKVRDHTAHELTSMDAGAWFDACFAGEPVPTYRQVYDFCLANDIWMNVEIKPAAGDEEKTGSVVAELTQHWLDAAGSLHDAPARLPLFSSFAFEAVMAAKLAAPDIPRALLVDTIPKDWQAQLERLDAVALHTNQKNLTAPLASAIKKAGYGLFCYTVNDRARARKILSWGVDAFCTDRIDLIGPDFVL